MPARIRNSLAPLVLLAFATGCSTQPSIGGGSKNTLLAGVATVSTKSYQPIRATTIDVDTTKIVGNGSPSGTNISLLWGLITLHDY